MAKVLIGHTVSFDSDGKWEAIVKNNRVEVRQIDAGYSIEFSSDNIYDMITQVCKLKGLSLKKLAMRVDIAYTTLVSRFHKRPETFPAYLLKAIAEALEIDFAELAKGIRIENQSKRGCKPRFSNEEFLQYCEQFKQPDGKINVNELAKFCNLSRQGVYNYLQKVGIPQGR